MENYTLLNTANETLSIRMIAVIQVGLRHYDVQHQKCRKLPGGSIRGWYAAMLGMVWCGVV